MNRKRDISIGRGKEFRWKENAGEVGEELLLEGGKLPSGSLALWLDCVTYQTSMASFFIASL